MKSQKGIITVDDRLATNVAGIWAAGDVRGGAMFTHTAWDDHRVLLSQIAGDGARTTMRIVPYAIFTDPEIGRVGMNEKEARASGKTIKVGRLDVRRNSKAVELGETEGFIKVILALQHKQLPPTIEFGRLNEHISLEDSPFYVNDRLQDWDFGGADAASAERGPDPGR